MIVAFVAVLLIAGGDGLSGQVSGLWTGLTDGFSAATSHVSDGDAGEGEGEGED